MSPPVHLLTLLTHTPALLDFHPANQEQREQTQRTAFLALWDPAPLRGENLGHKGSKHLSVSLEAWGAAHNRDFM